MDWTLAKIKSKVRALTGRPTTNQLTEAELLDYINNYYQYTLPDELDPNELIDWFELTTISGQGSYTVDAEMISLKPPVTIDGVVIDYYTDEGLFFELYPRNDEGADTYDEPLGLLVYDRVIYLRPIPDAGYALRVQSKNRPDPLVDDTDLPDDSKWGPLIAYGVAIDIHMDGSEQDEASEKIPIYKELLSSCVRKNLYNWIGVRAVPRF